MPKYIRASRTGTSNSTRDAFLRELEREGEKLIKSMLKQFTSDIEKEGTRALQSLLGGNGTGPAMPGVENLTSLVGNLVSYAINQPRSSTRSSESDRSRQTADQFRLSRTQAMAEATSELSRSDRNL